MDSFNGSIQHLNELKKLIKKQDKICSKCGYKPLCKQYYCLIVGLTSYCVWSSNTEQIIKLLEEDK